MPLVKITDHIEQGIDRLISKYRDKPRLAAWISSYLRRVQELEDAAFDVLLLRLLDNATAAQLAAIGRIVGQPNERAWDDDTYRLYIKARIRANKSDGHGDDIIDVLMLVEATDFVLKEFYPATMVVEFAEATTADPVILIELARRAKMAGVRLQLLYGRTAGRFMLCAGTTPAASTTHGGARTDLSTGGYLSGVLE